MLARLLAPVVEVRRGELGAALLMFTYSFLVMTAYNAVKPLTRSAFIAGLGAANLPYVLLAAGMLIGVLMAGYTWALGRLPRRWGLPIVQAALAGLLVVFYALFRTGQPWVSVVFYLFGLLLGLLLISQFWTLANVLYDPRQAKRLFGFIGGGAPLGGTAGSALAVAAARLGALNLLLIAAGLLAFCAIVVAVLIAWKRPPLAEPTDAGAARGVGLAEALTLFRRSRHLQVIALVISFAAVGAAVVEQQLNMAAEASTSRGDVDALTSFLGLVGVWMSALAFVVQVWLTSRIQRFLGVGVALLILPIGLGLTATVMLLNAALWAPTLARVLDQSLRYTVDKTTREILFLPLPADLKLRAKAFVDVTVDRLAKAGGALLLLVLIQPWGFGLDWQRLSYASLAMVGLWAVAAHRAKLAYLRAFRRSLEQMEVEPAALRLPVADLSTVETLVEELAHPDEAHVLHAIDLLEALDKRHLVTPLLLHHTSPRVRARALEAVGALRRDVAARWVPVIERLVGDDDAEVRAAAVAALAAIRRSDAAALFRSLLEAEDLRLVVTAGVGLAAVGAPDEARAAEARLAHVAHDLRLEAAPARHDLAVALRRAGDGRLATLLIPLVGDPDAEVAEAAIRTVQAIGGRDPRFVPALAARLADRRLKGAAREVLVSYGEEVVGALAYFLRDANESLWVRRHLPATLARIPCRASMDALVEALGDADGFLRYKAVAGLERLAREHPGLTYPRAPVERLALAEVHRAWATLAAHHDLVDRAGVPRDALLATALAEKHARAVDRLYRLLGLLYPGRHLAAARRAIEHGDARARASGVEYLDNVLGGSFRRAVMPVVDDSPVAQKLRRGYVVLRTRPRDEEGALLELIHDEDPIVAALAIDHVRERGVWALEGDLEFILAHRDPHDWPVFEAVSWALAERRLSGARAKLAWREPLPLAAVARALRRTPLFSSASVDELFRLAGGGHQTRTAPGDVLLRVGTAPDALVLLVDGRALAHDGTGRARPLEPPALVGLDDLLAGTAATEDVRAADAGVVWQMPLDEFRTWLADNPDLAQDLCRTGLDRWPPEWRLVRRGACGDLVESPTGDRRLAPVDIALVLRRLPLFSGARAEALASLAAVVRETTLEPGAVLARDGDPPAILVLLSGAIVLEAVPSGAAGPLTARGGDVVGLMETLAGVSLGRELRVEARGRALRIAHDDLVEVLSQRPGLVWPLVAAVLERERA